MKRVLCLSICTCLMIVVAAGCAGTAKGPSDAELVQKTIDDCNAAAKAKDIDKLMTYFSESFQSSGSAYFDKAGFKEFLDGAKQSGMLEGLEIDMKACKTAIVKDTATVGPVIVTVSMGSPELVFNAKKESGVWKITGAEISGV